MLETQPRRNLSSRHGKFVLRLVIGIGLGPDLKEHSVDAAFLKQIQIVGVLLLL